jgi:DNA-binding transcriptional LysR family regulator
MKQGSSKARGALDGVEAFLRVAERKSFTAAAAELGVTPSAISQTIRALEDRVGVPLLSRTTRSVGLTEAGKLFHDHARPAYDSIGEALTAARSLGDTPSGTLRLSVPRVAIPHLFAPILAGFCETYPDISVDIVADDKLIDLVEAGIDAGVRPGELLQADMVAVRLSEPYKLLAVATPEYFAKHGKPAEPMDLKSHSCIRVRLASGAFMPWTFQSGNRHIDVPVSGQVTVNDFTAHLTAAETGAGIAYVAEPTVEQHVADGRLELALEDYALPQSGLFLYYPSKRQVMPKLRAFIDYARAHFRGA